MVTAHALPPVPQLIPALLTVPPEGLVIVSVKGGPVVVASVPVPDEVPVPEDVPVPEEEDVPDEAEDEVAVNVAPQDFAPLRRIVWLSPVPAEQSPVQPAKLKPGSGAAWSPKYMLAGMVTWHSAADVPQLRPAPFTTPPVGRVRVSR
jgi:hypothetical protein